MADRFPLIIDNSEEKIKELVSGDNLDLTKSNLKNADYIQSAGVNVAGVATATSLIGDGSQLTNLPPSGGSLTATASGTLADGSKVIVNADGTVSAVTQVGSGWIAATLGGTSGESGYKVGVDSSGNVYVVGFTLSAGAGSRDLIVAKYNSSGTIQWQRTLGGSSIEYGNDIVVDSSDNVYVCGYTNSSGAGNYDLLVAKYNSSGTIQWQRTIGGTGKDYGHGIDIDSSGNIYVTGGTTSVGSGNRSTLTMKLNSSGTPQWQRTLYGSSTTEFFAGMKIDSAGSSYVAGRTNSSGSYDIFIAKYNSSGTIQWQRTLGGTGSDIGESITCDDQGNVYAVGHTSSVGAGSNDLIIAKYDSNGSVVWQRTLGGIESDIGYGVTMDSSGNVYVAGSTSSAGAGSADVLIAKYNSSGTIQWQRTLGGTGSEIGYGIVVDGSGNLYVAGYTTSSGSGGDDLFIAKLSDDGSGTGTYGNFTYASSSLTDSSSSLTASASSLTNASASLSDSSSSLTDTTSNLTSSVTSMVSSNLTSENFIGISDAAYTNGQTATIQIMGAVDDAQSSLTPGQSYYVQGDGTLSETADSPSVFAGTAIAATKLIVRG